MHQAPQQQWQQPAGAHYSDNTVGSSMTAAPMNYLHLAQQQPQQEPIEQSSTLTANEVGAAFALQYFQIMKSRPADLPRFYSNDSRVSRISPGASGNMEFRHATGPAQIRELLYKEHGCGAGLAVAIINLIECQDSYAGGVFIQFTGTLKFVDDTSRDFIMSILLARQDNSTTLGYFIQNDVFVFQNPINRQSAPPAQHMSDLSSIAGSGRTIAAAPQQQRLAQTTLKPATAPTAALAHPAAAPLPTTTAPQLSGVVSPVENSPSARTEELTAPLPSLEQPTIAKSVAKVMLPVTEVADKARDEIDASRELVAVTEKIEDSEFLGQEETETESLIISSNNSNNCNNMIQEAENFGTTIDALTSLEEKVNTLKPEPKSAWQTVAPVVVNEDVFEVKKTPGVANKTRDEFIATASVTQAGRDSTSIDAPPSYAKNSYAGALLLSGGFSAPCRVGYSIPRPAAETRAKVAVTPGESITGVDSQHENTRKSEQSASKLKSSRMKTLWVSIVPTDMSDEKIKKAIAEQLKGQRAEGHAVRIERVPGCQHGYIELDTELCARVLLEKGLHLQGREITVDFPSRSTSGSRQGPVSGRNNLRRVPKPAAGTNAYTEASTEADGAVTTTTAPTMRRPPARYNFSKRHEISGSSKFMSTDDIAGDEGWVSASRRKTKTQQKPTNGTPPARKSGTRPKPNDDRTSEVGPVDNNTVAPCPVVQPVI